MTHLLCRNKVKDFGNWLEVFSSHKKAHAEAGLILEHLWQAADDPNNIFYPFRVEDIAKARAFLSAPGDQAPPKQREPRVSSRVNSISSNVLMDIDE